MAEGFIYPLLKAIAFGGVLIGNIKSQLAESVTGIINKAGFMFSFKASAPTTGTNKVTMAKLLINAVSKSPKKHSSIK
jgi:hypothetical protein